MNRPMLAISTPDQVACVITALYEAGYRRSTLSLAEIVDDFSRCAGSLTHVGVGPEAAIYCFTPPDRSLHYGPDLYHRVNSLAHLMDWLRMHDGLLS